jgi:NAD(P)-dependent dehydrogenase (short-subunit alcohol dehydrogenase family)
MPITLITGANRGIGLALVRHLTGRGEQVIAVCRQSTPDLDKTGARVESGIDVTDDVALQSLVQRLGGVRLDTVVLNAGILRNESLDKLDADAFDGIREQFEANTLGPLRVARALIDRLGKGSKIGIITSRMGSMADNASGGYYGYRASKAAVNAVGRSLAMDLKPREIGVFLLHPGYVASDMTGGSGDVSTDESAAGLVARLDELTLAQTGTFWHANGQALPW